MFFLTTSLICTEKLTSDAVADVQGTLDRRSLDHHKAETLTGILFTKFLLVSSLCHSGLNPATINVTYFE